MWQKEAKKHSRTEFVFLSVDVIGNSELYTDPPTNIRLRKESAARSRSAVMLFGDIGI